MFKFQKLFLITFFIILFFSCILFFPVDDGLRHVGVAFEGISNWADVYPFSYFSDYCTYSPWYGYDLILRNIFSLLHKIPVHTNTLKFVLLKSLSLTFGFILFAILVQQSEILREIDNFESFLLATICVLGFLIQFFPRSMLVRPFVFGTIFLVYSIGASGYWKGAVSAGLLIFLYPYLSWFYILPVVFCHFFLGDKKFAAGSLAILVFFLLLQPLSFWKLQAGIMSAGSIRSQMEVNITELSFSLSSFYAFLVLACIVIFYPVFHSGKKKLNYVDLLLLTYLLPSILYIRTFIDIFLPLAFVAYSRLLMLIAKPKMFSMTFYWKPFAKELCDLVLSRVPARILDRKTNGNSSRLPNLSLKPIIFILYAVLILFAFKINLDQLEAVNKNVNFFSSIPKGQTILISFNQQYSILFVRPDLKIIPSSEIGMPSPAIRDEYIEFFKSGKFKNLALKTSARYLIEANDMYLDPRESKYLQFVDKHDKLTIWEILEYQE